jgi:O-antigen/teichoic acid export membrane protein
MRLNGGLSTRVARNTLWNVLGIAVPLPVAVLVVRPLLRGLGAERFGILALAWAIMGYFTLCDFGLGRATTRQVAEARAQGRRGAIGGIFWHAAFAHAALGLAGGLALALAASWLAGHALSVSPERTAETRQAVLLLALSVPLIVAITAVRGLLEGLDRFDLVAAANVPNAVLVYALPLAALAISPALPVVIGAVVLARAAALLIFFACAWRACPEIRRPVRPSGAIARSLIGLGGWLAISAAVVPAMSSIDRLIIASTLSASAVGFYSVPYDIVTRLWLVTGAVLGVLFPVFSGLAASRPDAVRLLLRRSADALLIALAPVIAVVITAAPGLLAWWLGPEFRLRSAPVAQALAVGMLFSGVANLGTTLLQAVNRASFVALSEVAQALLYAVAAWWAAGRYGLMGVAIAWMLRAVVQACVALLACGVLSGAAGLMPRAPFWIARTAVALALFAASWKLAFVQPAWLQAAGLSVALAAFGLWAWRYALDRETRGLFWRWGTSLRGAIREVGAW